jgi:hypothetical protein
LHLFLQKRATMSCDTVAVSMIRAAAVAAAVFVRSLGAPTSSDHAGLIA